MSKKEIFEHLTMSDRWLKYFKQYAQGNTVIEQLIHWISISNNLIDNINNWNEYLDKFLEENKDFMDDFINSFDSELRETVKNTINELKELGLLESIITEGAERRLSGIFNVKDFKNENGSFVRGDGETDDTTGIQTALDNAVGRLFFPPGIYKITKPLTLNKNVDLVGASNRETIIRADNLLETENALNIKITSNNGNTDVRNWKIESMQIYQNGGGKNALYIDDTGMQMIGCKISNMNLSGNIGNGGYSIYIKDNFAHGIIEQSSLRNIYLAFLDANVVQKNLFFGSEFAITMNLIYGVRNNIIKDNTIVNYDGQLHIINGDNIRFENNQCEHNGARKADSIKNPKNTMVWVEGRERPCHNTIISKNNFGGGTWQDVSVYVDSADKTVIEHNYFVAVNNSDIETTTKSINTFISSTNFALTQVSNPRTDKLRNVLINDKGVGTTGVEKVPATSNGWRGGSFYKTEDGVVNFTTALKGGSTNTGLVVLYLPEKFRPRVNEEILAHTEDGMAVLKHTINGEIIGVNIPTNKKLSILNFPVGEDFYSRVDFKYYDNFDRGTIDEIGVMTTKTQWATVNNNLKIADNELALKDKSVSLLDIAYVDTFERDMNVMAEFSHIPTEYTKSCRLVVKFIDQDNYIYIGAWPGGSNQYGVYKVVGGVETALWVGSKADYTGGVQPSHDVIRVEVKNDMYQFYVNDEKLILLKIADHITATKCGVGLYQNIGRIDNFGVY